MTTRSRRPAQRRKARPPKRAVTITLGPTPVGRRSGSSRGLGWLIFLLVRWLARWTGRVAGWTGRQAIRRSAGHVSRARYSYAAWRRVGSARAEHGFRTPIIWNLYDGTAHPAHKVKLDASPDPGVRGRQADDALRFFERVEQARADNILRHSRPPWWQRKLAKWHLWRIDWAAWDETLRARMAVLEQRRERIRREQGLFGPRPSPVGRYGRPAEPDPAPQPSSLASTGSEHESAFNIAPVDREFAGRRRSNRIRGDGSMANPIQQWADLADPNIHPLEFPEELTQHFAEVSKLLGEEAAMIEAAADSGKQGADTFSGYTEYLTTAQLDPSVLGPIVDANEEVDAAVSLIRQAAEAMARAATHAERALRAAESTYGDWDVPRFDQANAG
jgi:hypothetical protein